MNKTYKDTDLREALRRKYAETPKLPADFIKKMQQQTEPEPARKILRWRWIAAAACLIMIIGIGVTMAPFSRQTKDDTLVAEHVKTETNASSSSVQTASTVHTDSQNTPYKQDEPTVQTVRTNANSTLQTVESSPKASTETVVNSQETVISRQETVVSSQYADPNLHYAAYTPAEDSTYQAPSRMDEFIAKMADYHQAKAMPLDCATSTSDTTIVSTAYVFEDKEEMNLFGRLLQAACWYDSKTPGYLLNFSHQQFFFTLKDLHKNEKYLWIAERIVGGRILLYSSHSPIETDISSACYQKYREQLTQANYSTLQF